MGRCSITRIIVFDIYLTIVPRAHIGYVMLAALIIPYPTSASEVIILLKEKQPRKLLVIAIEWPLFLRHGIMADIPWPLRQSEP